MKSIVPLNCFFCLLCAASLLLSGCTQGDGEYLYSELCQNCHGENGEGLGTLYPPLKNSNYLKKTGVDAACIIRNGLQGSVFVNGVEYNEVMPPFQAISDTELTNILNYINTHFGNNNPYYSLDEVRKALNNCTEPVSE